MRREEIDRRSFLASAAAVSTGALSAGAALTGSAAAAAQDQDAVQATPNGFKKAVKYGMIKSGSTVLEKFQLLKKLGFDGVELDAPSNLDRAEVLHARDATGLPIHGVVDSKHWGRPLSSPDPKVRQEGLDSLLPFCVILLPIGMDFFLPNNVGIQNIITVGFPCIALWIRFTVGGRHIATNAVGPTLRTCQYCVFFVAIFWLCMLECLIILLNVVPAAPRAGTWDVIALLYCPYLLAMCFAMFPGWTETDPTETTSKLDPRDSEPTE